MKSNPLNLVDVHAHLDWPEIHKDIEAILQRASAGGVKVIISNGTSPASNRRVLDISAKFNIVKPALGIYPNDSLELSEEEFQEEISFMKESGPVAIGEIGLDYKNEVDKGLMKERFLRQVELAKELDVPVIVHSRKAEGDVVEILEESKHGKVVMHCFGGKKRLVERIVKNKWSFSIPAIVTRLQHFQMIVETCPLNQLLTETDSPFLSPYPNEKKNEPAFVVESLREIARIKALTPEECANQIFMNYQKIFL